MTMKARQVSQFTRHGTAPSDLQTELETLRESTKKALQESWAEVEQLQQENVEKTQLTKTLEETLKTTQEREAQYKEQLEELKDLLASTALNDLSNNGQIQHQQQGADTNNNNNNSCEQLTDRRASMTKMESKNHHNSGSSKGISGAIVDAGLSGSRHVRDSFKKIIGGSTGESSAGGQHSSSSSEASFDFTKDPGHANGTSPFVAGANNNNGTSNDASSRNTCESDDDSDDDSQNEPNWINSEPPPIMRMQTEPSVSDSRIDTTGFGGGGPSGGGQRKSLGESMRLSFSHHSRNVFSAGHHSYHERSGHQHDMMASSTHSRSGFFSSSINAKQQQWARESQRLKMENEIMKQLEEERKAEIAELRVKVDCRDSAIENLENTTDVLNHTVDFLRIQLDETKAEASEKESELQTQIEHLKKKLSEKKKKIVAQADKLVEYQNYIAELTSALENVYGKGNTKPKS